MSVEIWGAHRRLDPSVAVSGGANVMLDQAEIINMSP